MKRVLIPEHVLGQRLDIILANVFPEYSRSQLSQWLKDGLIKIDGATLKPKTKISHTGYIEFNEEAITPTASMLVQGWDKLLPSGADVTREFQHHALILYEDDDVLIVNKPAGLVVHPGAGNVSDTLIQTLLNYLPSLAQLPRAGLIHRLDKDTTGLLIIAKTNLAHTYLTKQMQQREIKREYLALVQGYVIAGDTISTPFGRHATNRLKMAVKQSSHPRVAITHYRVQQHFGEYFTLLSISLETGRTHQIRVHMQHIHHPVFGDPLYGKPAKLPNDLPATLRECLKQFSRQALHAIKLSFIHPSNQRRLEVEAPLPDDFKTLLDGLNHDVA